MALDRAEIVGHVLYADGAPAFGAHAIVEDALRASTAAPDGSFRIGDLLPGDYTLVVNQIGFATQRIAVKATLGEPARVEAILPVSPIFQAQIDSYRTPALEHMDQKAAYLDRLKALPATAGPNVVLILFDDLGWGDLSCYGNQLIHTPHMDSLAAEGARLTQFYAASPVCTPSRAALLTGRFHVRTGADHHVFFSEDSPMGRYRNALGWGNEIRADEIFLSEVMKARGYATGMIGKWHLGDRPGVEPNDFGFDHFYGMRTSHNLRPRDLRRNREIEIPDADVKLDRLQEQLTDEAVTFIDDNRGRPFFLYLPYTAPHGPHIANPDTAGRSTGGLYGDIIEDLDRQVGRVQAALDERGLRDNTVVIVTSDNGADTLGDAGPFRGYKIDTYEGGVRVPLIVRWPGHVPAGAVIDHMATNLDFMPTIAGLAGAPMPEDRAIDGADMVDLLTGGGGAPQPHLFYFNTWTGRVEAVRDERYKYRVTTPEAWINPLYPIPFRFEIMQPRMLTDMVRDRERLDLGVLYPDVADRLKGVLEHQQADLDDNLRGWR
jgi:arylsulfatase A-like enzyme